MTGNQSSVQHWYVMQIKAFSWAQFHNILIGLKFNPEYFRQNYTYRQVYQEC